MIQASVYLSPLGDFSLLPRLAPLCQESPGDVMISSTAHALEGPEDLPGETQQSLVPAVLEATRSLGQAAARVGQLDWGGGAWGEGGEQGRGCGQCYFERLAEQHP